jgi:hypothetical protein
MSLQVEPLPAASNLVAVLYGPLVLAGELGTANLPSPYARGQTDLDQVPSPEVPAFVSDRPDLVQRIRPVAGRPLTFRTRGLGKPRDVTLVPLHSLHHQRYTVYWRVYDRQGWKQAAEARAAAEARRQALERRTVDTVRIGEQQSEIDHRLQGERTQSGSHLDRRWRHAVDGGWFGYEVRVDPDRPMALGCTYWGSDAGGREFDILVEGEQLVTQRLEANRPGEFFDLEYSLPERITRGKRSVAVVFQARPGRFAGGLFGLRVLKAEPAPRRR